MLEQNIICCQTQLDDIAHSSEQTFICRQFFVGYVMGSRPMKRKKNLHQMIKSLLEVLWWSQSVQCAMFLLLNFWCSKKWNSLQCYSFLFALVRTKFSFVSVLVYCYTYICTLTACPRRTLHPWLHSRNCLSQLPIFLLLLVTCQKHPVCPFSTSFLVFLFLFSHLSFESIDMNQTKSMECWGGHGGLQYFAVLSFFSSDISLILILMCSIAV